MTTSPLRARARARSIRLWLRLSVAAARDALRRDAKGSARPLDLAAALAFRIARLVVFRYPLDARRDLPTYHRWLAARGEPTVVSMTRGELGSTPTTTRATSIELARVGSARRFSIVIPVWRPPLDALRSCLASIAAQRFEDFEVWICDDGSADRELSDALSSAAALDGRFHIVAFDSNHGIAAATNHAAASASGEFLVFVDHDDALHPRALECLAAALDDRPLADVAYSDEDKIDAAGVRFGPVCKPDWSPELLLGLNYVCHLLVVRRALFEELGGLRSEFDGAQDHDLALRATERARDVVHVPEVLYHWRILEASSAANPGAKPHAYDAGRRAVVAALERRGEPAVVTDDRRQPGRFQLRRSVVPAGGISVVVAFGGPADARGHSAPGAVRELAARRGPVSTEYLLVAGAGDRRSPALDHWRAELESVAADVRVVEADPSDGWSRACMRGARDASGSLLAFVAPDVSKPSERWLEVLAAQLGRPSVGVAGPRLEAGSGHVESIGLVLGLGGVAGHVLRGAPLARSSLLAMTRVARECSAVSSDCLVTPRSILDSCGGFDLELDEGDAALDYCLRVRQLGERVVCDPTSHLVVGHRPLTPGGSDALRARWARTFEAGDAYYNVNLRLDVPWCALDLGRAWSNALDDATPTPRPASPT